MCSVQVPVKFLIFSNSQANIHRKRDGHQLMMDLKIVIFALLLITLQYTVGDSSQAIPADDASKIERAEPSHHHHRRATVWGLLLRLFKHQKKKDNSETQFSSNMKWEKYQTLENLVSVSIKDNEDKYYYIARDNNCKPLFIDQTLIDSKKDLMFLVNPDNFDHLEWKSVLKHKMPPFSVETCDGHIIARSENGLGYMTAKSKTFTAQIGTQMSKNVIEVLTINFDGIAEEYLTNVMFSTDLAKGNNKPAMFKKLTVVNNNCKVMKQQVKIDNGFEETASFQTGSTLLVGGSLGIKIENVFEAGLKSDSSATETESNSNIKKNGYEYTQELDIPPQSSCNLVIISNAIVTTVPFTADLTRVYKNDDISTVSISGSYRYQESSEIKTNFESCTELPVKCLTKST